MKQQADIIPTWPLPGADKVPPGRAPNEVAASGAAPPPGLWEDDDKPVFDFDFGRFFRAFWTRKWFILALGSLLLAMAGLVIMSLPPIYRASAQILIDPAESIVKIQAVSSPLSTSNQDIASEIEVIRSSSLADQLIDAVDFRSHAAAPISQSKLDMLLGIEPGIAERTRQLLKTVNGWVSSETENGRIAKDALYTSYYTSLSAWRVPQTFVISIAFETKNPEFSTTAANELAAIYIANQIEQKRHARTQASKLLTENLSKLEQRIKGSKEVVNTYRQQSGLTDSISTDLIGQQLSEQMSQLVEARAVAQTVGARLSRVETLERNEKLEELLSLINSPSAQSRWDAVREAARQLAIQSQDYGPNHPTIIQLDQELEDLSAGFRSEVRTAVQSMRTEANVAAEKVAELQKSIIELRRSMTDLSEKENEARQLEADADISRTLHETLTNRIREAESAIVEGPDARILNLADVPAVPYSTSKRLLLLGAFFGAFTAAGVIALGLEFLNGGYQSEEEVHSSLGWPILATIPKQSRWNLLPRGKSRRRGSAFDESFNALYTNLEFHGLDFNKEGRASTILVTSSVPAEGKSTVAHGLACVAAGTGAKVLVIDADLRKPTVHKQFKIANHRGLSSCDPQYFDESLATRLSTTDPRTGVDIIPAGTAQKNPQQLLRSGVLRQILRAERPNYDLIVIDTPPILAVADAQLIGKYCDAAIMVIKWGATSRRLVKRAVSRVSARGMPLAGCVLTQVAKGVHRVGTYQYLDYS